MTNIPTSYSQAERSPKLLDFHPKKTRPSAPLFFERDILITMQTRRRAKTTDAHMKPTPKKQGKKPTKQRPLTVRQQRFAELVASGMSGTQAWLQVYPKCAYETAQASASKSIRKDMVAARIAELRKPVTKKLLFTKDKQREELYAIGTNPDASLMARIRAIEVDAKLAGFFAPEQVVMEQGPRTLDAIKERADKMASALDLRARMLAAKVAANGNGNGHSNCHSNGNGHVGSLSRWNPS